jgi:hypothetical protein
MKKKQELKSLFLKFQTLYNIERVAYSIVLETKSKPDATDFTFKVFSKLDVLNISNREKKKA